MEKVSGSNFYAFDSFVDAVKDIFDLDHVTHFFVFAHCCSGFSF